jgi:hypothetical protein
LDDFEERLGRDKDWKHTSGSGKMLNLEDVKKLPVFDDDDDDEKRSV